MTSPRARDDLQELPKSITSSKCLAYPQPRCKSSSACEAVQHEKTRNFYCGCTKDIYIQFVFCSLSLQGLIKIHICQQPWTKLHAKSKWIVFSGGWDEINCLVANQ